MTKRNLVLTSMLLMLTFILSCAQVYKPVKNLGKSDIDMVADTHIRTMQKLMQGLIVQIYERNPEELRKTPRMSIEKRLVQIFRHPLDVSYKETNYLNSVAAINLALDEQYENDRVFALFLGINSMLRLAYNNQEEFFLFDEINPQKLYDSARNLENVVWRLRKKTSSGATLLELGPVHGKNSFEETIAQMVALQDVLALIIADKTKRIINRMIHGAATGVMVPL